MSMRVQEIVHSFEVGRGSMVMKWITAMIVMVSLAVWYDLAAFRNLSTQEGMDAAQLARNLADGKGYTTDFIRPFSIYLLSRHRSDHDAQVKQAHPDLANPPVYPVILAGVLKTMPFGYPDVATSTKSPLFISVSSPDNDGSETQIVYLHNVDIYIYPELTFGYLTVNFWILRVEQP